MDRQTDRQTDMTENITYLAFAGGNYIHPPINLDKTQSLPDDPDVKNNQSICDRVFEITRANEIGTFALKTPEMYTNCHVYNAMQTHFSQNSDMYMEWYRKVLKGLK